jgi:hypothetical protein
MNYRAFVLRDGMVVRYSGWRTSAVAEKDHGLDVRISLPSMAFGP